MDKQRIELLRETIEHDIEKAGGIEEFNNCSYAPEAISSWINTILNIMEEDAK